MRLGKAFLVMVLWSTGGALTAFSQPNIADSLELALEKTRGADRVDILNRLTYEFITVDNEKVIRYSDEALQLSGEIKYIRGEGVAQTYRGVHEYLTGQFAQAHRYLHRGLRLAQLAGDKNTVGYTLLQLGNCGLEEVDTDSAFLYFNKAYQVLKDSSNPETLSKIYRNLSALYGQRFKPDSQQYFLDRAIAIRRLLPGQKLLTDALALQAGNKLHSGDIAGAEILLNEAEEITKRYPGDLENLHDVQHVRALILFQKGQFKEALALVDSARNYYFKTSLLRKYITLLTDIGKIFSDRGEYELALNNFYDALKLSQLQGYEAEAYILRSHIGWVNFYLGDWDHALQLADESLNKRSKKFLKVALASTLSLKGAVLTKLHRFAEARECIDSVFLIHKQVENNPGMSEALMNLGTLETELGHYTKALALFQQSLQKAEHSRHMPAQAYANWGIANIYFQQREYARALEYLNKSEAQSKLIHANETLILNYNTRQALLAAWGRYKESLHFSLLAGQLKDSLHQTALVNRYTNLEKILAIEQRDRDIRELQQEKQQARNKIRLQEATLRQQYILLIAGVIGLFMLAALAYNYYSFYKRIKELNISITDKNKELNRLYKEVSDQKEEIQAQANVLAESNKNMNDLNRNLEKIVAEKTLELRNTNDMLSRYNNELLQFSYTISHNLRGPVARLLGLTNLLVLETGIEQTKQLTALVQNTAADLDIIIKDLSKLLELRNEPQHHREQVSLHHEWAQSISLLQDKLTGEEIITTDFHAIDRIITVKAMLQSIFYNLLSNAIKFKSDYRILHIRGISRLENDHIIMEVSDNGIGFDTRQHKDKLFKLYTRFHSHVEGRGLGLYLIKSQVEILGGSVDIESRPGQGTTFRIRLPLWVDTPGRILPVPEHERDSL